MSQAPAGKNDWIKGNYEKAILLAAMVALLVSCAWLVSRIEEDPFFESNLVKTGDAVAPRGTEAFDEALAEANRRAAETPEVERNVSVSESRVSCIACGRPIPFDAMECPFPSCKKAQPEIIDPSKTDTDGDGIPDIKELAWGLDPQDPADAAHDADGDGFTNLEEFLAGTDPKEAGNHPLLLVKLRIAARKVTPFYLKYVGKSTLQAPDGSDISTYQLNMFNGGRSYFLKLGETVQGYKLAEASPDGNAITMVRQSDGRTTRLFKGRPVSDQEILVRFVSLADKAFLPPVHLNDTFSFDGQSYKVIDITRESVVIQNADTAETVTIHPISPEEKAQATGASPSSEAPPVASAF